MAEWLSLSPTASLLASIGCVPRILSLQRQLSDTTAQLELLKERVVDDEVRQRVLGCSRMTDIRWCVKPLLAAWKPRAACSTKRRSKLIDMFWREGLRGSVIHIEHPVQYMADCRFAR